MGSIYRGGWNFQVSDKKYQAICEIYSRGMCQVNEVGCAPTLPIPYTRTVQKYEVELHQVDKLSKLKIN